MNRIPFDYPLNKIPYSEAKKRVLLMRKLGYIKDYGTQTYYKTIGFDGRAFSMNILNSIVVNEEDVKGFITDYESKILEFLKRKREESTTKHYYEADEPYYALIKAKNLERAKEIYIEQIADDEGDLNLKEVTDDYAMAVYSRIRSEDGEEIPIPEIVKSFRKDRECVLIADGSLN